MTNHTYFNLAGHDAKERVHNNILKLESNAWLPADEDWIPTKKVQKFDEEGPDYMDFRKPKTIGESLKGHGLALGFSEEQMDKEISTPNGVESDIH